LRRPRRNSADLTGQRALETPKALPVCLVSTYSQPCAETSDIITTVHAVSNSSM
jgi:hypothetical protein